MPKDDERSPGTSGSQADQRIAQIGAMLGCSVEVFTDGAQAPSDVRRLRELIALWNEIDEGAQEQVLALIRKLAKV